ncbi:MAG: 3-hydroxyacyl-CoA dehydrogenase family protein [Promethearchaeia archaeon]
MSEDFKPRKVLTELYEEGKLGKKTGEGFYDWPDEVLFYSK